MRLQCAYWNDDMVPWISCRLPGLPQGSSAWCGIGPTRLSLLVLLVFSLMFSAAFGHAASIAVASSSVPSLDPKKPTVSHTIRLTGRLEEGDAAKLRRVLTELKSTTPRVHGKPMATIELSSDGGDVYEGLNIGYLLREFDVATIVRSRDSCLSACALAFLGGTADHVPPNFMPDRSIEIGGQVGFHSFHINTASTKLPAVRNAETNMIMGFDLARGGSALLVRYAAAMGIDPGFIARLLGRPPEEWEYVDIDERFVNLTSCPIGIDRPHNTDQYTAATICNHATGWFNPAHPSQARRTTDRQAKRRLLEIVQKNVEILALRGPLARQLAGVLDSRDDRLIDAVYADLRSAGVPLPEMVGPTYEVSGYVSGDLQMQCHVSFSLDNPDRYDVIIEGPSGLSRAFRSAPAHCRRLFLWDRNEVLNPVRR